MEDYFSLHSCHKQYDTNHPLQKFNKAAVLNGCIKHSLDTDS